MSYNASELREQKIDTKSRASCKITEIKEGSVADFFGDNYFIGSGLSKAEIASKMSDPAINIVTDNKAQLSLTVPKDGEVKTKSKLAKYKKTYGKYPEVGDTVQTRQDENGFNRIVLEA